MADECPETGGTVAAPSSPGGVQFATLVAESTLNCLILTLKPWGLWGGWSKAQGPSPME